MKSDRQFTWIGVALGPLTIPVVSAVLMGSLNAGALALWPFTVVRSRWQVLWASDALVTEDPFGAVGQIVISEEVSAAGVASIPDPISNSDGDWQVYQPLIHLSKLVGVAADYSSPAGTQYTVDSKAMRKVGPNKDLVIVVANANAADGADIHVVGRTLVKLH